MKFIADLHVHSHFSRATARNLDLENLYVAAQYKGLGVVGTGDFTHPEWFAELSEKLEPAKDGLYRLKDDFAGPLIKQVPPTCRGSVRFILQTEISNIYKKDGKTRKNHNLVFLPDLASAAVFNRKLDAIGNIHSDGRPILGLDARNLLEILLETDDQGILIPAHIWTPWFSVLGSKSGFDSVAACFEDLTEHIFAVETGLSSDPAMNWRVSGLDAFTLVSNSDAHSPMKLAREANCFNTDRSYMGIYNALKSNDGETFQGTLEFHPEEGKYHFDGHRKCNQRLSPSESLQLNNICPVCQKPLTLGVLHRVEELADRDEGTKPGSRPSYRTLFPLTDILAEIFKVGPNTKKVRHAYNTALASLGPELTILKTLDPDTIETAGVPLLAEAIKRMRSNRVHLKPGYDGEFGKLHIFDTDERDRLLGQQPLFVLPKIKTEATPKTNPIPVERPANKSPVEVCQTTDDVKIELNPEQLAAVQHPSGPLLITAGPGTGKTRTLTQRIAFLITRKQISPERILAVTFTHKAAREMQERLAQTLPEPLPMVTTFHAFCLQLLKQNRLSDHSYGACRIINDEERLEVVSQVLNGVASVAVSPEQILDAIVAAKQQLQTPQDSLVLDDAIDPDTLRTCYTGYQAILNNHKLIDFEDLLLHVVLALEKNSDLQKSLQNRYPYILIDEYQDLNLAQYRLIKALTSSKSDLFAIGDPNQAIYGFRGADVAYFKQFINDYPSARQVQLTQNYRSTETILEAAYQVIQAHNISSAATRVRSNIDGLPTITVLKNAGERAEAVAIGKIIERQVGGIGFNSIDFGKTDSRDDTRSRSFKDFAVLFRTRAQGRIIAEVLNKAGIPCQQVGRRNLFELKGIRELLSLYKLIYDQGHFADFQRVCAALAWGVGTKTVQQFKSWFYKQDLPLDQALQRIQRLPIASLNHRRQQQLYDCTQKLKSLKEHLDGLPVPQSLSVLVAQTRLEKQIEADSLLQNGLQRLLEWAQPFDSNITAFLDMAALQRDPDTYNTQAEQVALMTIHAVKGLEFPVVFVCGCEQDLLPYKRNADAPVDWQEERRLFYVALTRARDELYLAWAQKRRLYGQTLQQEISPFIADIDPRLLKEQKYAAKSKKQPPKQKQLKLF